MKKSRRVAVWLLTVILCSTWTCSSVSAEKGTKPFRGVWVSTVYNLDYPSKQTTSVSVLKQEADRILDGCVEMGMTAVFLQVRPSSDALYPSSIYPWSRYLTGTQGLAPEAGFDPLAYWVSEAHKRGLELHAWINPYRITRSKESEWQSLSEQSPAKQHPEWTILYSDGNYYFDPALPEVRQLIVEGALEIVKNYDVDGIHLDDYFYPGTDFNDTASYSTYGSSFEDIGDFRRDNVNQLISQLNEALHRDRSDLSFGISPSGIWANKKGMPEGSDTNGGESYYKFYADTRKWVKERMVDYICPQIYWYIGYKIADYKTLAYWWADVVEGTDCKLYIGLPDYKADADNPEDPWYGTDAIRAQLELNSQIAAISGEVHFRYSDIISSPGLMELYREYYRGILPEKPDEDPEPSEKIEVYLDKILHPAYMQGSSGSFMPEKNLTRAEAAAIFARLTVSADGVLLFDNNKSYGTEFPDIKQGEWYQNAVGFVQQCGVISGLPDGAFHPDEKISRAEFVSILFRYEGDSKSRYNPYPDVPSSHWASGAIAFAKEAGLVAGMPDGSFYSDKPISRAEAVRILNAATKRKLNKEHADAYKDLFRDVTPQHWAYNDIIASTVYFGAKQQMN